jgi:chromosome segregation ATPase
VEEITQLEQKLAAKIASMNAGMNKKQIEDQTRLTQVDQRYHKFKAEEPRCLQKIQEFTRKREAAEEAVADIDAQQSELTSQLQSARQGLINMERASSDRLNKFGEHVQLDDQAYRQAFESMLGNMLCTWVVTCDADKETLRNILSACRQR